MDINWETIEHICISIAVVGAAITYIYRGWKFAKKPADDVHEKLKRDFDEIRKLRSESDYMKDAVKLLIRSNLTILGHLSDGNHTSEMAKMEKEIQTFLIHN